MQDPLREPIFEEEEPPPRRELPAFLGPLVPPGRAVLDWWRDLFVLSLVSILWSLLTLTVVGWPAATSSLLVVARASALHEAPTLRLFFTALRAYFVRSWQLGLTALASLLVIYFDLPFYLSFVNGSGVPGFLAAVLIFYLVLMWLQTLSYAWAMLITRQDLKLGQMLRNGALISLRYPFRNLLSCAFLGLLLYASVLIPPLIFLFVPPVWALLTLHNLYQLAPEIVPDDAEALRVVS